jgi:GGDEF domain-containing protein
MEAVDDAAWVIRRILKSLAEPIRHSTHEVYIRATIGASQFPADGEDAERLLAPSAIALSEA